MKHNIINRYLLISLYITVIYGCTNNDTLNNTKQAEMLHFDVTKWNIHNLLPKKLIKNISFIPLETTKDVLMSDIAKIIPFKDKYYIMDKSFTNSILIFNKEGKYIRSIGTCGRGPNEYVRLRDFTINKKRKNLLILDSSSRKIIIYDLFTGKFIKSIKLKYYAKSIAMPDENTISLFSFNYFNDYTIRNININNNSQTGFIKNDGTLTEITAGYIDFHQSNQIYYAPYAEDFVYKISTKNVSPYIKFDFGKYKIPTDKLRTAIKNDLSGSLTVPGLINHNKWGHGITNIIENNDFITLRFTIKQQNIIVIYSKESGKYYYGTGFEGLLKPLRFFISPIAVDKNHFLCIINSYDIIKIKKSVEKQDNKKLKHQFKELTKKIARESNPVIISIEFNQF